MSTVDGEAHELDLVVVGSGGAGMAAAIVARRAGARVALVERGPVGGTCVNVGCVPSKTLLAAAGSRFGAGHGRFPGAPTSAGEVQLAALVAQKDRLVDRLRQSKYVDVAEAYGFDVVAGQASFVDRDTVAVDGRPLGAAAYVIATGAEPARPDVSGLDDVEWLTSTTAMELPAVPRSLVVVGGGYVGLEQAQLFAHLGSSVTIVGRVAPRAEPELAAPLRQVLTEQAIAVVEERATAVARSGDGVVVTTASGRQVGGERVLVATGRRARTDGLNLPAAGVRTDHRGFVVVDDNQRTTNPRVYAAGDVAGSPQHVYVAAAAGKVAASNALGLGGPTAATVDHRGLPAVVFTRPQLASAGLTEAEAMDRGHACDSRVLDLADVPRALVEHETRGAVKVVAEVGTGRVLGVHALADGAGDLMLAATYAIRAGMTVDDVADTWAPYLTMAESLRMAAGLFRDEMPTSCCA